MTSIHFLACFLDQFPVTRKGVDLQNSFHQMGFFQAADSCRIGSGKKWEVSPRRESWGLHLGEFAYIEKSRVHVLLERSKGVAFIYLELFLQDGQGSAHTINRIWDFLHVRDFDSGPFVAKKLSFTVRLLSSSAPASDSRWPIFTFLTWRLNLEPRLFRLFLALLTRLKWRKHFTHTTLRALKAVGGQSLLRP